MAVTLILLEPMSTSPSSASGRLFLRNIGMCFDHYLKEAASEKPRYSKTA